MGKVATASRVRYTKPVEGVDLGEDLHVPAHLLPQLLRAARVRAGLTQRELGRRMGLFQASVAGWEAGHRPVKETTIEQVAKALDLTTETLLRQELDARRRRERKERGKR